MSWASLLPRVCGCVLVLIVTSACVGHLSVGANLAISPRLVIPGATMSQELTVEGDGLLGGAVRQSISQGTLGSTGAKASGPPWEIRDNSDSTTVRVRLFRTVDLPVGTTDFSSQDVGATGTTVVSADYGLFRTYSVTMQVTPPPSTAPTTPNPTAQQQQLNQAALAAVSYDTFLTMPGIVRSTNGLPSDSGRLVWHLKLDPTTPQSLTAESLYVDWPRLLLVVALLALVVVFLKLRRRASRPATPPPAGGASI